jgi:hypothetical protein
MIRTLKIFGLFLALVAVAALTTVNPCAAQTTNRPLSDFLTTQGSTIQYFPPVPDFVGWTNNNPQTLFAAVDYAGVVANYLASHGGPNLGTTITGGVTETHMADGTYEVVVTANAKNALAWACDVSNIFTNPTLFGSRGSDLASNPALPYAVINSSIKVTFITTAAGAPIPDLTGPAPYNLKNLKFSATGSGPVPGGRTKKLTVTQSGVYNTQFKGATADAFPAESVTIK